MCHILLSKNVWLYVSMVFSGTCFIHFLQSIFLRFWLKYACQYQDAPPESSIASALKAQWRRLPAPVAHALTSFGPIADLCRWLHFYSWQRMALTFVLNWERRGGKKTSNWARSRSMVQPSGEMYGRVDTQGHSFFISGMLQEWGAYKWTEHMGAKRVCTHLIIGFCGERNTLHNR